MKSKFLKLLDEFGIKLFNEFIERNGELTEEEISELEYVPKGIDLMLEGAKQREAFEMIKERVQNYKA